MTRKTTRRIITENSLPTLKWAVDTLNDANDTIFANRYACGPWHAELAWRQTYDAQSAAVEALRGWFIEYFAAGYPRYFDRIIARLADQHRKPTRIDVRGGCGFQAAPHEDRLADYP